MATDQTHRIISKIFEGFDLFENEKMTEESLSECVESNVSAIENPDLSLVEEKFIKLVAFLDETSYVVPYSKKRTTIIAELKKLRIEISQILSVTY